MIILSEKTRFSKCLWFQEALGKEIYDGQQGIAGSAYTKEIRDLFGNEKDEGKDFRRRLNFYPTFFDQISLEVINPHDRKTKAGTQPIYIESVPEGASGTFSLLYVPFDLMGKRQDEVKAEVKKDMEIVSDSLEKMMRTYGFSAKKGSGFGVVKEEIKGRFNDKEFSGFKGLKKMMEETHNDR